MASTNKTQYFELSQYTSSDKPTYLVDYNGDMSKIDGGLHTATVNSSNALTSVGNIANLNTTVKTDTVSAINEVVGNVADNSADIVTNSNNISTNSTSIGVLANLSTVTKTDLVSATNEVNSKVGNLSNLNTTYKNDIVGSINEIKADINSSASYSTTEQVIGTWIDGKTLYRKVIECGALPNNSNKDVLHNIQNFGETISCRGMAVRTSDERALTIPDSTPGAEIGCGATNTNVYIVTHNDRSSFNDSFLIIEYTKTTD